MTNAFILLTGIYIYVSLARQISARERPDHLRSVKNFGLPDAILASALVALFTFNLTTAHAHAVSAFQTRDLVANALLSLALFLFIAGFLRFRGLDLNSLGGLSKIGFWRALGTGMVLLFAAYPLIFLADAITQRVLGSGSTKQEIVQLFSGSRTMEQRILVILLAVAIAPVVEEFIFRFFLYGVVRRYVGRFAGLALNSLLFAAVHAHLPSFGPLLVLGSCFTIAYEWSGSLLVTMAMHSLFNSLTLVVLAFPSLVQQ
ncbi:MAG: type II CAAX endopeptidase family protein [Chthoniobacterales bacterium]